MEIVIYIITTTDDANPSVLRKETSPSTPNAETWRLTGA